MAEYEGARPPSPLIDERITLIHSLHDEAFLYIDQGITCDELGNTEQAVNLFEKGLKCIDKAVAQYQAAETAGIVEDEKWTEVQEMISEIGPTRENIQCRLDSLMQKHQIVARSLNDPPATDEESLSSMSEHGSIDFDIIDGGQNDESSHVANASETFKIPDGVEIYFISGEGDVSDPSYPSKLAIYTFDDHRLSLDSLGQGAPAFLKIGSWTYPLLPGRSPVLHANYGAYIFPDVTSAEEGASVGVIISDSVMEEERIKFENLLNTLTDYREQEAPEMTSTFVAAGIGIAAKWVADKAEKYLQRGKKHKPEETPKTKKGIKYAMKNAAAKVSGFVARKVGQHTASLITKEAMKDRDGTSKLEDFQEGAHEGLKDIAAFKPEGIR